MALDADTLAACSDVVRYSLEHFQWEEEVMVPSWGRAREEATVPSWARQGAEEEANAPSWAGEEAAATIYVYAIIFVQKKKRHRYSLSPSQ
jgi:hypothetical protein